jgi:mannose-6-phosphate isomerase-like protein (cupin superfamily)
MTSRKRKLALTFLLGLLALRVFAAEPLAQRILHTDLTKVPEAHSHGSEGWRKCQLLVPAGALDVPLHFINRCQMMPGGGVAEHFHNASEEMFTILNGEAQFSIDSHTSQVKGPAGAPLRLGHSHAVYNPTNERVDYLNFNVNAVSAFRDGGSFNLGDSRNKNVKLDEIPQFMVMHLDKTLLKPVENFHGGTGAVQYRRALDSDVFLTNWAYMDHEVIPPGASDGLHRHRGVEEVYYVMDGSAVFQLNDETAPIGKGDAVPVKFNEAHAIVNNGTEPIELLIMGIAAQKNVLDTELGAMPRGMGR